MPSVLVIGLCAGTLRGLCCEPALGVGAAPPMSGVFTTQSSNISGRRLGLRPLVDVFSGNENEHGDRLGHRTESSLLRLGAGEVVSEDVAVPLAIKTAPEANATSGSVFAENQDGFLSSAESSASSRKDQGTAFDLDNIGGALASMRIGESSTSSTLQDPVFLNAASKLELMAKGDS